MRLLLVLITGLLLSLPPAAAQCGELIIYRPTGLQGEEPVYLFQDGVRIAALGLGDRYRAVVCQDATYFFDVRFRPNALPVSKAKVYVGTQDQVYLKVNLPIGMELPTINQRPPSKAQRDLAKGNRFRGPVRTLSLRAGALAGNTSSRTNSGGGSGGTTPAPPPPSPGGGVGNVQIVDNFRFELANIVRAGDMVRLDWKITNLAADDRTIYFCPNSVHFYDPSGNLLLASKTQLINSAYGNDQHPNKYPLSERFPCGRRHSSNAILPGRIPVNASVIIRGVSLNAESFVRGKLRFTSTQVNEVGYTNLVFPDPETDQFTRRFDGQDTRFIKATAADSEIRVQLRHINTSTRPSKLFFRSGKLYDQDGTLLEARQVIFGNNPQRYSVGAYRFPEQTIQPGDVLEYTVIYPNAPTTTKRISRLTATYANYTHSWEDLTIGGQQSIAPTPGGGSSGGQPKAPAPSYVTYRDFTSRVARGERVAGKRIILKKLYFDTGSSDLLAASYPQLDELANLLQQNPGLRLEVSGHTDATGEATANLLLSQRRADEIRYYLIGKQIAPDRVSSVGKGEDVPVSNNADATGRADNRRVEILVLE